MKDKTGWIDVVGGFIGVEEIDGYGGGIRDGFGEGIQGTGDI